MDNSEDNALNFSNILERAQNGEELTVGEGKRLLEATGQELERLLQTADRVRRREVGDTVTYVINRNINFTNICKNSCKFCAFRKPSNDPGAFVLSKEEVAERTKEAIKEGATEICLQGGVNPELEFEDYLGYLKEIRKVSSEIHIHGYSPEEINHMSEITGLNIEEIIQKLEKTGLNSVPGTAAEILIDRVRKIICPRKIRVERWEEIIKTCHNLGIPTTATIMYGHVETPKEIVQHLVRLRNIQKQTSGFTELVPLPFASKNTELEEEGLVKNLSKEDHLKIHAICRLMLPNIKNIQTSWVKLGPKLAQKTLNAGVNDFSGTLIEENITRAAGGEMQRLKPSRIRSLITETGRTPKQRTTTYEILS